MSIKLFGKAATDIGCYAKDQSTRTWCDAVGWPRSRSFAISKFHGVGNCRMLCEEVRRKADFFMNAWVSAGSPAPYAFDEVKFGYTTTAEYSDWFDQLSMASESFKAAMDIRDMCPRPVPA